MDQRQKRLTAGSGPLSYRQLVDKSAIDKLAIKFDLYS